MFAVIFRRPINLASFSFSHHLLRIEVLRAFQISFGSHSFGMGVVTISSSAARTLLGLKARNLNCASSLKRLVVLSFKSNETKPAALVSKRESLALPLETSKESRKISRKVKKRPERVKAIAVDEVSPSTLELDYCEAAAKLEKLYKRSPDTDVSDEEVKTRRIKRRRPQREKSEETEEVEKERVVRSQRKGKRLNLEKRISMRTRKEDNFAALAQNKKHGKDDKDERIDKLVREYTSSTDLGSFDWKKMKIPPVLPSSEHAWLFKLMQPIKEILKVKETLKSDLERELTDDELAEAINIDVVQLRKQLEVGEAARNKLIKHNLRLVLFVMNKYFQDFSNGPRFQDLCQAGVRGLMTAIDRFEPRRKFRLSTYGLFWIRHAIVRWMTLSSFTKVSFGLESVRVEIQKAKQELLFKLQRAPTIEEITEQLRISPERYYEVMRASKPVASLHARHVVTEEELINAVIDVEGDSRRQPALLRLALDDVLDSLKPKESMVIRQRYGLDGKGDRTLSEIAGNLNISREMVRKYEVKALMKLKHPARVDYLRYYIHK